jgi:hypothetical protein
MLLQSIELLSHRLVPARRTFDSLRRHRSIPKQPRAGRHEMGLYSCHPLHGSPIGLLLYVLADKEPRKGEHQAASEARSWIDHPLHRRGCNRNLAAVITATLWLPMWIDLTSLIGTPSLSASRPPVSAVSSVPSHCELGAEVTMIAAINVLISTYIAANSGDHRLRRTSRDGSAIPCSGCRLDMGGAMA